MSRNTNALFWIVCGAIFVVTVYIIITTNLPTTLQEIFSDSQNTVDKADNGATPDKANFRKVESDKESFTVEYDLANNATRYRCDFGTEKNSMKSTGIIYMHKDKVICKASHLKSNTKYYFKMITINNDIMIESDIKDVKTK